MDFFWQTCDEANAHDPSSSSTTAPPDETAATTRATSSSSSSTKLPSWASAKTVRSIGGSNGGAGAGGGGGGSSSGGGAVQGSIHWTKNRWRANSNDKSGSSPPSDEVLDHVPGFVDGDFRSGKVQDLQLESKCWVTAHASPLLAVGTATSLQFYDTTQQSFALIHQVPVECIISALRWIDPQKAKTKTATSFEQPEEVVCKTDEDDHTENTEERSSFSNSTTRMLLATARLDGSLCLYNIDLDILETQGPSLLYWSATNRQQIRCLDAGYLSLANHDMLLLVAGDKQGSITVTRFAVGPPSDKSHHKENDDGDTPAPKLIKEEAFHVDRARPEHAVLGLVMDTKRSLLVTTTKGGWVQVHHLVRRLFTTPDRSMQDEPIWSMKRNGAVQSATFSACGTLAFGGYDKTVVLVDTEQWIVARELQLQGTINTIEFDPQGRYVGVGCRDKTFTIFDTSTYVGIKVIHTPSWVTSISWLAVERDNDDNKLVAIRSETKCVSVLDLSPIQYTNLSLSSGEGASSALSWSRTGKFLARADGSMVVVADATSAIFPHVATFDTGPGKLVTLVAFCTAVEKEDLIAVVTEQGQLLVLRLRFLSGGAVLEPFQSVDSEANLKALVWSPDGELVAVGGQAKKLHIYSSSDLKPKVDARTMKGRIWDIDFVPAEVAAAAAEGSDAVSLPYLGVALGDYSVVLLDSAFEPVLQIQRSRTSRCLKFHPTIHHLVIGDGAETVAVVDYEEGQIVTEFEVEGRVNDIEFSPSGDYLLAGTDNSHFVMYETFTYRSIQEFTSAGFALSAAFSPSGKYLALGSANANYKVVSLGPFLGTDLVPLESENGLKSLPLWAKKEVLYRSGNGPSMVQRLMARSGGDNLRLVAEILREHPNAMYTFDRASGEGCFETVLRVQKPALLKLAVINLVNGTLDPTSDKEKNFLTTSIPQKCRDALPEIIENYPPDYIVDILKSLTFMKVPNTSAFAVKSGNRLECGSNSFTDPWSKSKSGRHKLEKAATSTKLVTKGGTLRTPAVLPLPGLGEMDFLSCLLKHAPHEAFDNDALAVVLRVLWRTHIRKYYYFDCCLYILFYISWVLLVENVENTKHSDIKLDDPGMVTFLVFIVVGFNALFNAKELVEGRYGRRPAYWRSLWNIFDVISITCVYAYAGVIVIFGKNLLPLSVVTTLFLTVKLLSYLVRLGTASKDHRSFHLLS